MKNFLIIRSRVIGLVSMLLLSALAACSGQTPSATTRPAGQPVLTAPDREKTTDKTPAITAPAQPQTEPQPVESSPEDLSRKNLGPMDSIKDLDKKIEAYHLGQNLTQKQIDENIALKQKIIRGTFDIQELCRQSLDKHWNEIKPEQQSHFVELMTKLLEKKAIFSKEQLHGENKYYQIHYQNEVIEPSDPPKSVVKTRMVVTKRKVDLNLTYKLLKKSLGWKIYDVIVDDASLLSNYKFQFDRIIQKGGFEDLIKRMETKLDKIGNGD